MTQKNPLLTVIHFNDVYDIQPKKNKGGIVNFKAKVQQWKKKYSQKNVLVLFSGDAFSPSILTNIYNGSQMVHALNQLGIDAACYGNHQFDFEDHDHTLNLAKKCNFPWLLGNLILKETGKPLGDGKQYEVFQLKDIKVGVFGIAGSDWISILADYDEEDLEFIDSIQHSNKMCTVLRQTHKCDIVIALTHMRNRQDLQLPQHVKGVDLVLGGHDHVILEEAIDQTPVIKSGCNFNNIGRIHIYDKKDLKVAEIDPFMKQGRRYNFNFHVVNVQNVSEEEKDKQLEKFVNEKMQEYTKNDKIVGYTEIDLETRFSVHRTHQTAYGNFVADLMRLYLNSEISFANSGGIRNDCIVPAGPLKYSQISNIIDDALVVKKMSGQLILKTLEYSIQGLPQSFRGSFLHVSGLTYRYNSKQLPGQRIVEIMINGVQIEPQRMYEVAMFSYTSHGGDGYEFLKDCEVVKDQAQTTSMLNLLMKFFNSLNKEIQTTKEMVEGKEYQLGDVPSLIRRKSSKKIERIQKLQSRVIKGQDGKMYVSIKPQLEKRIIDIQQQMKEQFQDETAKVQTQGYNNKFKNKAAKKQSKS